MIYHFDTQDARKYGTDEAILLYNIVGWLRVNKAEGRNRYDGRTWTYNTARALVEVFDEMWGEEKIRRLINNLVEKHGVLLKGNYNAEVGRRRDDRTLWLALADEARITPKKDLPKDASKDQDGRHKSGQPSAAPAPPPAEPPSEMTEAPVGNDAGLRRNCGTPPSEMTDASVGNDAGLRRNCGTPPSEMTDASVGIDGHIKEQKETSIGKTASEKQQQPLLPPQLPFDEEPAGDGQVAAAAEVPPEGEMTGEMTENLTPEDRDARRVVAHTLHSLGVKGTEAEALVAGFPLEEIRRQIEWLPYNNCEKPGYWLPRYIRDRWPKPPALVRQEAEAAKQSRREASGTTATQERQREKDGRQCQERRRREYRERLGTDGEAALLAEADAAAMAIPFCRDTALKHPKRKDAPSYRQMRSIELDKIVDARLEAADGPDAAGSAGGPPLDVAVADPGGPPVGLDVGLTQREPPVDLLGGEPPVLDGDVEAGFGDGQPGGGFLDGQVHRISLMETGYPNG